MNFIDKIKESKKLIKDTLKKYDRVALACSFGKDSMVVLHLCLQIDPQIKVFSIMTPFKFNETLKYKDKMEKLWNLNLTTFCEKILIVEGMMPLWRTPDYCCEYYKVNPTKQAVKDLDAWITGLRRTEGRTRTDYKYIELDRSGGGLVKINPILEFTELDIWRYLAVYGIPVNPMYKQGYRSLGCKPCSRKEKDENETERAGRWSGTSKCGGECGLHTKTLR
jgi:phosphoadenosine phosphosulfate reductase